ncbi:unnamed protein product [Rangifer tarandus platyrhynchus]|uniref:Uncharacterized protein n=1 Tax=Rangifer tarandus platyrhynchus TaxID=3082113 RepID=A0AC59YIL2_RANTA
MEQSARGWGGGGGVLVLGPRKESQGVCLGEVEQVSGIVPPEHPDGRFQPHRLGAENSLPVTASSLTPLGRSPASPLSPQPCPGCADKSLHNSQAAASPPGVAVSPSCTLPSSSPGRSRAPAPAPGARGPFSLLFTPHNEGKLHR